MIYFPGGRVKCELEDGRTEDFTERLQNYGAHALLFLVRTEVSFIYIYIYICFVVEHQKLLRRNKTLETEGGHTEHQ